MGGRFLGGHKASAYPNAGCSRRQGSGHGASITDPTGGDNGHVDNVECSGQEGEHPDGPPDVTPRLGPLGDHQVASCVGRGTGFFGRADLPSRQRSGRMDAVDECALGIPIEEFDEPTPLGSELDGRHVEEGHQEVGTYRAGSPLGEIVEYLGNVAATHTRKIHHAQSTGI
jgi:hypothetical protein